ncbi:hypothetical protein Syun_002543 [Stephania yunnanensis]|uniref:Uncharacterized protein n=1 Tax=Stephania yunnanensis TaxID=152371 RepID=A0AAP0LGR2_9MAGN
MTLHILKLFFFFGGDHNFSISFTFLIAEGIRTNTADTGLMMGRLIPRSKEGAPTTNSEVEREIMQLLRIELITLS